ncbi:MAG: glycosyltransferase [Oscillospiraceae bacterium]
MLLSIGMIVKNEEKYLERCLTSLKPILENVDSELIIADTGSTDNTVEIAKKFTDKVYFFEWIDDFSAARNFTMEKSSGEWFMFLDADEIFQSCDDIIHFFNSDDIKTYGNAAYTVRSYTDEADMSDYIDSFVLRIAKRYPDVKFANKIHEALTPLHGQVKLLTTVADHYGYLYNTNGVPTEQAYLKSKRNLEPLLKSLEAPEVEYNVYNEIADCYNVIGEKEKALEYVSKGLEVLDHRHIAINQYYSSMAVLLMNLKRYYDAIEICSDYFGGGNPSRQKVIASDMDMYAIRGESYFRIGEFVKALDDFRDFFSVYNDYKNNKLNTEDLLFNHIKVKDRNVKYIFHMFFETCIELHEYSIAEEYLKRINIENYQNDRDYMLAHFRHRSEIMLHTGWKSAKNFISLLDDENKKQFFRILRGKMFYTDKPEELFRVLSEFKDAVPEAEDAIELYRSYFNDDLQYEQIKSFIEKFGSVGNVDILLIMLTRGMDISCFWGAKDINIQSCAHDYFEFFPDKVNLLEEYDVSMLSADVVAKAASFYGWAMVEALNKGKSIIQLFELFGRVADKWQSEFPNEENVPGDIRAGIIVYNITEARKKQDYHTCISEMRRLIKVCPDLAPLVSEYRKLIEQEISPKKDVHSELSEMAEAVKRNIRSMLDAGDITSAENTLLELEKLCPADAEIGMLKYQIKTLKTMN